MIFQWYRSAGELKDGIVCPRMLDFRQLCPPTSDQGQTPHCAAHSISNIAEALIWKHTGRLVAIKEDEIYKVAKTLDGLPGDGTTLEAAIAAAFKLGSFNGTPKLTHIKDAKPETMMRAIHKFTLLHLALDITEEWGKGNVLIKGGNYKSLGGHAILACGYDDDGLYIQNSWGQNWGDKGFAQVAWPELKHEFIYAYGIEAV